MSSGPGLSLPLSLALLAFVCWLPSWTLSIHALLVSTALGESG